MKAWIGAKRTSLKTHAIEAADMFAVIFEVQPRKERFNDYLELAKFLKAKPEAIDGFVDNERFSSKRSEGRVLSLSTWRDEKSVVRWRTRELRGSRPREFTKAVTLSDGTALC